VTLHQERTHPFYVEGCLACRYSTIGAFIPYQDQFHNTTINEQMADIKQRAAQNGYTIERAPQ
jgi:hypothetical protein